MKISEINKLKDSIQVIGNWTGINIVEFWIVGDDYYPVMGFLSDTGTSVEIYERRGLIYVFQDDEYQMEIPVESGNTDVDILEVIIYLANVIENNIIPPYTSCEWI